MPSVTFCQRPSRLSNIEDREHVLDSSQNRYLTSIMKTVVSRFSHIHLFERTWFLCSDKLSTRNYLGSSRVCVLALDCRFGSINGHQFLPVMEAPQRPLYCVQWGTHHHILCGNKLPSGSF